MCSCVQFSCRRSTCRGRKSGGPACSAMSDPSRCDQPCVRKSHAAPSPRDSVADVSKPCLQIFSDANVATVDVKLWNRAQAVAAGQHGLAALRLHGQVDLRCMEGRGWGTSWVLRRAGSGSRAVGSAGGGRRAQLDAIGMAQWRCNRRDALGGAAEAGKSAGSPQKPTTNQKSRSPDRRPPRHIARALRPASS